MGPIDLARCDDFLLADVHVQPALRQLVRNGVSTTIEPKVMQLLVALAVPPGRVVSRDEFVERCWQGRIVGEDAINRIVGKLRRVLDEVGAGTLRLETVARVGYRLVVSAAPTAALTPSVAAVLPPSARSRRWGLAVAAAAAGASVFLVARPTSAPPVQSPAPLPMAVSDLETRGLAAMFGNTPEATAQGIGYLRQATAAEPRRASVWGSLAMAYVLGLGWAAPPDQPALVARARDAAANGLALDPRESRSMAALASLAPTYRNWAAKDRVLAQAEARARSDSGPLLYQRTQFLLAVGRTGEALADASRLARLSPLVPWIQAMHIDLLLAAGRIDEADKASAQALAIWPRDRLIWFTRFDMLMFHGQPQRALAMAADRAGWPDVNDAQEIALAMQTARALASHDPAAADAVVAAYRGQASPDRAQAERAMRAAAALDRPEAAIDFARRLYADATPAAPRWTMLPHIGLDDGRERPTAALFLPPLLPLWQRSDFHALLSDIGLVAYWRGNHPPDACRTAVAACRADGIS